MINYENLIKAGIDIDGLLKRLMGNSSLLHIFVKKFIEDPTFENLKTAFAVKDIKGAEMASHTLKGMCGNLSLTELYTLFTKQVNAIRSGEYDQAESMMEELTAHYQNAIHHMNMFLLEGKW